MCIPLDTATQGKPHVHQHPSIDSSNGREVGFRSRGAVRVETGGTHLEEKAHGLSGGQFQGFFRTLTLVLIADF